MATAADLSSMTVCVQHRFAASPAQVWQLLSDLPAMAALSPEVAELAWDDQDRVTFTATNRRGDRVWTVGGHVLVREAPRLLRWTVSGPQQPSSTWSYELTPTRDGVTVVEHRFAHGPGGSLVRAMVEAEPARHDEIVAWRCAMLADDMARTLRAAADLLR